MKGCSLLCFTHGVKSGCVVFEQFVCVVINLEVSFFVGGHEKSIGKWIKSFVNILAV